MAENLLDKYRRLAGLQEGAIPQQNTFLRKGFDEVKKQQDEIDAAALAELENANAPVDWRDKVAIAQPGLPESIPGQPQYNTNLKAEERMLREGDALNELENATVPTSVFQAINAYKEAPKTNDEVLKTKLATSLSNKGVALPQKQPDPAELVKEQPEAQESVYGEDLSDKAIEQAQKDDALTRLIARLGASASQLGASFASLGAGAPVKVDTSGFDNAAKFATKASNLTERRKMKDYEFDRKGKLIEYKRKQDSYDANSNLSKSLQKKAQEITGRSYEGIAAADIEDILKIENLKLQKEAIMAQKAEKLKAAGKEDEFKYAAKINGLKSVKDASVKISTVNSIKNMVENPSAFADLSILFGYMRSLDPDSVVREGEQLMFKKTGSISQKLANALNGFVNGETLGKTQREEILSIVNRQKDMAITHAKRDIKPFTNQAKKLGIKEYDILPSDLIINDLNSEQEALVDKAIKDTGLTRDEVLEKIKEQGGF